MRTREAPDFGGLYKNTNCSFPFKIEVLISYQQSNDPELCENLIGLKLLSNLPEKLQHRSYYIRIKTILSYVQTLSCLNIGRHFVS